MHLGQPTAMAMGQIFMGVSLEWRAAHGTRLKRAGCASIYCLMLALLVACLAALFVAWVVAEPFLLERRREKLRARPFPATWREILERRVPYVRLLPRDLRRQLEQHMQVFIAEKSFVGCGGLEISDEVRVTIAAQACLLILNRKTDYYPSLTQILVY